MLLALAPFQAVAHQWLLLISLQWFAWLAHLDLIKSKDLLSQRCSYFFLSLVSVNCMISMRWRKSKAIPCRVLEEPSGVVLC